MDIRARVQTDPASSWMENRNGVPDITVLHAEGYGRYVRIEADGKRGSLRGGIRLLATEFIELCVQSLESIGYQVIPPKERDGQKT